MVDRLLIVSSDGHMDARPALYRDYLDPDVRSAVDDLEAELADFHRVIGAQALADEDDFPGWDVSRRLRDLDAEGVAADVVHHAHQGSVPPFFSHRNRPYPPQLRSAGVRAFHSWLGDCMRDSGARIFGVADPGPCLDMPTTLAELRRVAELGFVAVSVPQAVFDPDLPPVHDPYFEKFWAACDDLGLALSLHAGWGVTQGKFWEFAANFAKQVLGRQSFDDFPPELAARLNDSLATAEDSPLALDMGPRRALWQLMVGGVFDRHPGLKLVLTEVRADWVPATLAVLDRHCRQMVPAMNLMPSEYWSRNCFITPSSIHTSEVEMRHRIGLTQIMFGSDYPHPEGTWPQTGEWLRFTLRGVPLDEVRLILADNAVRCYGLDRTHLESVAQRIGPTPEELFGDGVVDGQLLNDFDHRAGLRRPAEQVDASTVLRLLDEDLASVGSDGRR